MTVTKQENIQEEKLLGDLVKSYDARMKSNIDEHEASSRAIYEDFKDGLENYDEYQENKAEIDSFFNGKGVKIRESFKDEILARTSHFTDEQLDCLPLEANKALVAYNSKGNEYFLNVFKNIVDTSGFKKNRFVKLSSEDNCFFANYFKVAKAKIIGVSTGIGLAVGYGAASAMGSVIEGSDPVYLKQAIQGFTGIATGGSSAITLYTKLMGDALVAEGKFDSATKAVVSVKNYVSNFRQENNLEIENESGESSL